MQTTTTTTTRVVTDSAPVLQVIDLNEPTAEEKRDFYCYTLANQCLEIAYLVVCCRFFIQASA